MTEIDMLALYEVIHSPYIRYTRQVERTKLAQRLTGIDYRRFNRKSTFVKWLLR